MPPTKLIGTCALAAAVLGAVGVAGVAGAPSAGAGGAAPSRIAGNDRYATAAAVSAATFPNGSSLAYLATGTDFADALTAAAAGGGSAPVLMTDPGFLPQATGAELARLHPGRIDVIGGPAAVPEAIVGQVHGLVPGAAITRISGSRRFETATLLSQATFSSAPVVYIATGLDYPDALSAAAAAASPSSHGPVLLVTNTWIPDATADELRRLKPGTVHVIGGTSAVDTAVFNYIVSILPGAHVDRLSGSNRYNTSAAISDAVFAQGASTAFVATGFNFPDALAAAVASGGRGPVLLVGPDPYASAAMTEITRLGATQLDIVGGPNAIPDALVNELQSAVKPPATATSSAPAAPSGGASPTTTTPPDMANVGLNPPPVYGGAGKAVAVAQAQLGKPYEWAGAGPDTFDCSGLVMYAWAAAGVNLPHNAEAQAMDVAPVALNLLQPGDIVFYGPPGGIYHDGLYIGNGQMIEAAHTGVPVRIADIHRDDLLIGGRPEPGDPSTIPSNTPAND